MDARRRSLLRFGLTTLVMFGFGFALVPLYGMLCDAIGLNGKVKLEAASVGGAIDRSRTVTVELVTTVNGGHGWTFMPPQDRVTLHPGEFITVNFTAQNLQAQDLVAQAVPQVAPWDAAKHLRKSECFCFRAQPFKAGETRSLPVVFTIDPALPATVDTVTLSYTIFDATAVAARQPVVQLQEPRS